MPRKSKVPSEEKIRLVEGYLSGKIGYMDARAIAGISDKPWRRWISLYKMEGADGLQTHERKLYTAEVKTQAARDYLNGLGSLKDICEKYKIRSDTTLSNWIKVYTCHGEFKTMTGGSRMTTGRKTTKEERLAITKECIATGSDYREIALKYDVSYQQVYTWVKKIQEQGEAGLADRRGHRSPPHEPQTKEDWLQQENEQLKKANYNLQMENDFIKKMKELERGDR